MTMIKNFIRNSRVIYILIFLKRILFFIKNTYLKIQKGLNWLFTSKEHTNFTFTLSTNSIEALKFYLKNSYKIDKDISTQMINSALETKVSFKNHNLKKSLFYDLNKDNNWDYRIVAFILFSQLKVDYIIEFGISHGKLPYLIYKNLDYVDQSKSYIGIENNLRKGGLSYLIENTNQFNFYWSSVEDYLSNEIIEINNSIVVCSTHEKNSENFIFDFLKDNKLKPQIIISDNTEVDSAYYKFVNQNDNYETEFLTFVDKKEFISPLTIGVSKFVN